MYYLRGPDSSDLGTIASAQALYFAISCGSTGLYVALNHCTAALLKSRLRTKALTILHDLRDLDTWFLAVGKTNPTHARA